MSVLAGGLVLWFVGVFCVLTSSRADGCRRYCEHADPIPRARKVRR